MDETLVDQFSDTLFYMVPQHLISYVYGGSDIGVQLVTYEIKMCDNGNSLNVTIIDPPHLMKYNKEKGSETLTKDAFMKVIEPAHLFRYLKVFNIDSNDYELSLNPLRYRHLITISILKLYLRENFFLGELEAQEGQAVAKKANTKRSDESPGIKSSVHN